MFQIQANGRSIKVNCDEILVSGSVNTYLCDVVFSSDFNGLDKTVTFKTETMKKNAEKNPQGKYVVPWELLQEPGQMLFVGITGSRGDEYIFPTVWKSVRVIQEGASNGGTTIPPPTDDYYNSLQLSQQAFQAANSVLQAANAGEFDGKDGKDGKNMTYEDMTPAQKEQLVDDVTAAVLSSLPVWTGGAY